MLENAKVKEAYDKIMNNDMSGKYAPQFISDIYDAEKKGEVPEGAYNYLYYKVWSPKQTADEKLMKEARAKASESTSVPVSTEDMEEAKGLCQRKVMIITHPDAPSYSKTNKRAELKKMIENRVRTAPNIARAMLVYIQNYQKEHNVTVFTPKNEIWAVLPKLNQRAEEAFENGTKESEQGKSGSLYSGDGIDIVENRDAGRFQITFPGKPDGSVRYFMKQRGFHWSPTAGAWQTYNTDRGRRAIEEVANHLGLTKNENETQKSFSDQVEEIKKAILENSFENQALA